MASHPHSYTLALLKLLLDKAEHTLFPAERLAQLRQEYEKIATDSAQTQTQIEEVIVRMGKEIWPYAEALEELFRRHGQERESKMVCERLAPELCAKYQDFLAKGNALSDFRQGATIELAFSPEEKLELSSAAVDAHAEVLREIASTCRTDRQGECEEVIAEHKEKLGRIEKKLAALKALAQKSEKWRAEIEDKIATFERAFGYLERTFHEADIEGVIDYYQGVIES